MTLLLALLVAASTLLSSVDAFAISPRTLRTSTTAVYQSSVPQDKSPRGRLPSWVDLPNRASDNLKSNLYQTELSVGRVAMVSAIGLLIKEVVTGESILEQVSDVIASFTV